MERLLAGLKTAQGPWAVWAVLWRAWLIALVVEVVLTVAGFPIWGLAVLFLTVAWVEKTRREMTRERWEIKD
jgi:RsiW-degrading membrane proteinase PrsW (M82 family)